LKQNWENFIYKWGNIEPGSYFFEIKNEETEVISGVTYSHTAPFAKRFEAVVDENLPPKSITGLNDSVMASNRINKTPSAKIAPCVNNDTCADKDCKNFI